MLEHRGVRGNGLQGFGDLFVVTCFFKAMRYLPPTNFVNHTSVCVYLYLPTIGRGAPD
jgi:hypothetical protein